MGHLVSVCGAGQIIGCNDDAVRYLIRTGRLSAQKIGHAVILDRAEVERYAAARRVVKGTAEKVEAAS